MEPVDELELDRLLNAPEWTEAHDCFQEERSSGANRNGPYGELYGQEVLPFWLYARMCLEEEGEAEKLRNQASSVQPLISRLPRTILACIFLHLQEGLRLNNPDGHRSEGNSDTRPNRGHFNPYSWLDVTLVCRHWRNTAYRCPQLWSWINLHQWDEREVIRSLLILSGDETLHVVWDTSVPAQSSIMKENTGDFDAVRRIGELEIKLDLVMDERARIGELEFDMGTMKEFKLVPWKEVTSVSYPWSRLAILVLRFRSAGKTSAGARGKNGQLQKLPLLPAFREPCFPVLRDLVLDGVDVKWEGSHLPELVRLEIRNVPVTFGEGGLTSGFERFVSCCTRLRTLIIDEVSINLENFLDK